MSNDETFFINGKLSTRKDFLYILKNKHRYYNVNVSVDMNNIHNLSYYTTPSYVTEEVYYTTSRQIEKSSYFEKLYEAKFYNHGELQYQEGILKY